MMGRPGLFAFTVLAAAGASGADVFTSDGSSHVLWKQVFATPQDDWINDLLVTNDSGVLAVGFVGRDDSGPGPSDWRALASRLGLDGTLRARHEYGVGGGIDAFWAPQPGRDGRMAFGGFTTRIGGGGIDAWIAVTASDGTLVRENAFGGRAYDRATDIASTADGGFVLAGQTESFGAGERDVFLVKTDADGIEVWRRTYGGPGIDRGLYIERTADDAFVIAGAAGVESDVDVLVMKVDGEGRELWRRTVGRPGLNDIDHGLALYPDGRILLTGYAQETTGTLHDLLAITLSADGNVLSHEMFGGADDDRGMLARLDARGRAWLTGYTKSAGAGGWDLFIARLDDKGRFEPHVTTFGGAGDDHGTVIVPLTDESLLLAGYAQGLGGGGQDAFVMRVTAPKWTKPTRAMRRQTVAAR